MGPWQSVYAQILTNNLNTVVYAGVTKDLVRRVYKHKHCLDPNSNGNLFNLILP